MTANTTHAYQQAPWRKQIQSIGLFLLALAFTVLIAGVYLNITARSAAAGTIVQSLETDRRAKHIEIAELYTELGELTSAGVMEQRASEMGFQPADLASAVYLVVPQYPGRQPVFLAPPPIKEEPQTFIIPAYRQSLWELMLSGTIPFLPTQGVNTP